MIAKLTQLNYHLMVEEIPFKFPNARNFRLHFLEIKAEHLEIELENVIPKNGMFYRSEQPWNVLNFELRVDILHILLKNPDLNQIQVFKNINIPSIKGISRNKSSREFTFQRFVNKKDLNSKYSELDFKEQQAPFNQIKIYANEVKINIISNYTI